MANQMNQSFYNRQEDIANGNASPLQLPKHSLYTICNLRGGVGKTSLAFNLSSLTNNLLAIDTCPQGNLSYFFDDEYSFKQTLSSYEMLLPYFFPGFGKATGVAKPIKATNQYFNAPLLSKNYFIKSSNQLYLFPSQMANSIAQARALSGQNQTQLIDTILSSLKTEITREMKETSTSKCLIDTSPFFAGATHLALLAAEALLVTVRTDQQSVNSLNLLIDTLSNPASEFRKNMLSNGFTPKIQMIILTHCGWSTVAGARNKPNQQTKMFIQKIFDIVQSNINFFTTDDPYNHIFILDDFLGSGRMSTALRKPINMMTQGDTMTINRVRTSVNKSIVKIQHELQYISDCIWT
ncbi:ParA family protein [Desulfovibrio cuneatus]|uniref:ParA family protein n=1 Tax=Desulfovibrio cuneatus TaxID=159728 RepID=UPI000401404D|nr:AAA family ATPase [Desulfovibrio cuneatus]